MRNTITTLSLSLLNNENDVRGKKELDNTTEMPLKCYILKSHAFRN